MFLDVVEDNGSGRHVDAHGESLGGEEELDPTLKNLILAAIGALKVSFVIEIEVFKKPFKPLFLTFI